MNHLKNTNENLEFFKKTLIKCREKRILNNYFEMGKIQNQIIDRKIQN